LRGLRPDHANTHFNLAVSLRDKGDLDGAIAEYREVLRLEPDHERARSDLVIALGRKDGLGR
jgi:predicted TPR repeat methyltransferase